MAADDSPSAGAGTAEDTFADFPRVADLSVYRRLPHGWWVAATDIVDSTGAIAAGRYKAVNMAGASAISAVVNALGGAQPPFAFGGDGATMALAADQEAPARDALARTARWAGDELGLEMRAALVPLADIRAAGRDVRLAYFAPSAAVRYAMFAGGGMEWAEDALKAGRYAVAPAPAGARPDLTGLSCRWKPMASRSGVMLSLIVRRAPGVADERFLAVVAEVLATVDGDARAANPVPEDGPSFGSPLAGFDLEARAGGGTGAPAWRRLRLLGWRLFAWAVVRSGLSVGGFEAAHYRAQTALNSDFRKYHDGLAMTLDCTGEEADRIEALLGAHERAGIVRYGTLRQGEALMTCIVPSYAADDHYHFVDGAGGGYAEAARRLKARAG